MNLEAIKAAVTSKAARQILIGRKHSPKILFVAGTIGVVGTVVLACRATLKLDGILEEHEKDMADLGELHMAKDTIGESEHKRGATRLKLKTALTIGKAYLPAVGLGVMSVTALTGSHVILTKRNSAVMAAYAGLDRAYKAYRQRVATEYGEDTDRKFALGGNTIAVEEKLANGQTKMTEKVDLSKTGQHAGRSPYAVLFDEKSRFFSREPGMNPNTIVMKQNHANDKLRAYGHLFLNEVYDMLGLPRTSAGQVVGWIYDKHSKNPEGDNYITFGVFDSDPDLVAGFIDGEYNQGIWLDFNVDGLIWDKI